MRGDFPKIVPYGTCQCGCGQKVAISKQNHTKNGYIKGEPMRVIPGHQTKFGRGNPKWRGGRVIEKNENTNYVFIHMSEHPQSNSRGYVREHTLVAEKALNRALSRKEVVHHIDGNGENNDFSNLLVFPTHGQHIHFHNKTRRPK